MARTTLVGFEYGNLLELFNAGAGCVIESATVNSSNGGAYSLKIPSLASPPNVQWEGLLNLARCRAKIAWRTDSVAAPSADMYLELITFKDSAGTAGGSLWLKQLASDASFSLVIRDSSFADVSTTAITVNANQWYYWEADCTKGAGTGSMSAYQDTVQIGATVTNQQFGANNIDQLWSGFQSVAAAQSRNYFFDDMEHDDAVLCALSTVLLRQYKAGAPTYDAFTKTGGATIDACCNDTPFSAASFVSAGSNKTAAAQTGLTASFSATQTGHGAGVIAAADTINGIKVGAVMKCSAADSTHGIRRRFNGVDTDTTQALTTGDALYETLVFADTLTNLNASEFGCFKVVSGANRTVTMEDGYICASVTKAPAAGFVPFTPWSQLGPILAQ